MPYATRVTVPKGVFHFVENEHNFEAGIKLPDAGEELDPLRLISELMQTASKAQNDKHTLSGIYVPMPFGMRPLNLQISQTGSNSVAFEDGAHPPQPEGLRRSEPRGQHNSLSEMSEQARTRLQEARLDCIGDDVEQCDKALDAYFRARFGASPMEKAKRQSAAAPRDSNGIAQTELASWLLPSLRERLGEIQRDETGSKEDTEHESVENNEILEKPRSSHRHRRRRAFSRRFADAPETALSPPLPLLYSNPSRYSNQHSYSNPPVRVSRLNTIRRW